MVKNLPTNVGDMGSVPGLVRFLGVGNVFISTLVFLLGKSHGQRSLVGHSQWGPKELDMTKLKHTHTILPKETRKITKKQPNFMSKATRERTNKIQG